MQATVNEALAADAQKAKLLLLFCSLGLALFILDLASGVWLWNYVNEYRVTLPAYDRFLGELRAAGPEALVDLAMSAHAGWEACEQARGGIVETVVHITLIASFIGLVLFSVCALLAYLLHQDLVRRPGGQLEPLPPDNVDDTWE